MKMKKNKIFVFFKQELHYENKNLRTNYANYIKSQTKKYQIRNSYYFNI